MKCRVLLDVVTHLFRLFSIDLLSCLLCVHVKDYGSWENLLKLRVYQSKTWIDEAKAHNVIPNLMEDGP